MRSDRPTTLLCGWGRYPRAECHVIEARCRDDILAAIGRNRTLIAYGNGRSYGDAAINPAATLHTRLCRQVIAFNSATGQITCEAGLLLAELLNVFVPQGWFPPVVPGTRFVTIGGMIAADVHGKNHHDAGSFGTHIERLELALADGTVRQCSPQENAGLFAATIGGMGLTGIILSASFRMQRVETRLIRRETLRARDFVEVMAQFEASKDWPYSVAWIDCLARGSVLGRAVLDRGAPVGQAAALASGYKTILDAHHRKSMRIPCDFPSFALNSWSVRAFNALYYRRGHPRLSLVDYEPFFYPLDRILEWNRIYGASGLIQYQCVLPLAASRDGLGALLQAITAFGSASFLSVLKRFGPSRGNPAGLLSFPMEGYTLALDFRANAASLRLVTELDAIVTDHGGRLYLAKDARMGRAMLRGYPGLQQFREIRGAVDPAGKFASLQSRRLGL